MKLRKLALSLLTGLAVGSSLLGAGQVLAQDTVKIGGNFELTGDAAAYGTPMSEAAKLAVKEVNENGGLLGGEVEYVEYDNTSDLTEAASVAQRLASEDVVGIVGPATTGDSNAQIPVIQEAAVPAILPAATGNGFVEVTCPSITLVSGAVKTSSVGIFAINGEPSGLKLCADTQMWPSGNPSVKSVPGAV